VEGVGGFGAEFVAGLGVGAVGVGVVDEDKVAAADGEAVQVIGVGAVYGEVTPVAGEPEDRGEEAEDEGDSCGEGGGAARHGVIVTILLNTKARRHEGREARRHYS